MPIVSISEAARLTGKSRQTLHRHIVTGKLSKCNTVTGSLGIDISELIRVYGNIKSYTVTDDKTVSMLQQVTGNVTPKSLSSDRTQQLEKEVAVLKIKVEEQEKRIEAKQETIDSLKTVLKLLEHRQEKKDTIEPDKEDNVSEPLKNDVSVAVNSNTGLLGRLKKLFS